MKDIFPEHLRQRNHGLLPSQYGDRFGLFVTKVNQFMVAMIADDGAVTGWEHVSVTVTKLSSASKRPVYVMPTWEIMATVKDLFWEPEEEAFQFHPPRSQYVNFHPTCLHLWKPTSGSITLPPPALVGPQ